jgi:ABC-type antimicrobial peptide transport system permease subunit
VGIVNETFARTYFGGRNPVGQFVGVRQSKDLSASMEIVGYVRDAVYGNLREAIRPTVYVPLGSRGHNTFMVRVSADSSALLDTLRREVPRVRPDFRVRTSQRQSNFVRWHLLRERLLAALSLFFGIIALVLAAVGLYGVLNYLVTQQRREIGVRIALGARSAHILRRVGTDMAAVICLGSAVGLAAGFFSGRFVESLLFEVKASDVGMLLLPILTLGAVAVLASLPPAIRAARTDPAQTLRSE